MPKSCSILGHSFAFTNRRIQFPEPKGADRMVAEEEGITSITALIHGLYEDFTA